MTSKRFQRRNLDQIQGIRVLSSTLVSTLNQEEKDIKVPEEPAQSQSNMKSLQNHNIFLCLSFLLLSIAKVRSSVLAHYDNEDHDVFKRNDVNMDELTETENKLIKGWRMMDKMLGCSKVPQCAR